MAHLVPNRIENVANLHRSKTIAFKRHC